ncbi:MAG: hypothetical protein KDA90_15650 [Planctomycetaceae bacterium]|nr:hypothetical protein [Planctomycetaceae bacterium]
MRIQPWYKAVFGATALITVSMASLSMAQTPYPAGPGGPPGYGTPYYGGGYAPGFQAPFSNNQPGAIYPPGLDPTQMQPWPMMSPFQAANVGRDSTYNQNGLWYREVLPKRTDWTVSAEAIAIWYRSAGGAAIGSPAAPLDPETNLPVGVPANTDPQFGAFPTVPNTIPSNTGFFSTSTLVFPIPFLDAGNAQYDDNSWRFRPHSGSDLGDPSAAGGIRLSAGYETEDGSGVSLGGWWAAEAREVMQLGTDNYNGVPVTQALIQAFGAQNLEPYGSLPLNNGEYPLPDFGPGSTAKFDVLYQTQFSTQASGANLSFYLPRVYDTGAVTVRPMWGARYLFIDEAFGFRGIDSGFTYDLDDDINPTGASADYSMYEATMFNRISSHLAGPEVGFRVDLGSPRGAFHVYAETNLAIAVNYEKGEMRGNNIGDPLVDINPSFNDLAEPRMLADGVDARFQDQKDSAHVSPVFHQSVFADFDLFGGMPHFKKMPLLEDTRFRLGYTLMYAGQVARPMESIEWRGFPQYSFISLSHENWWAHQLTAAIDWQF